MVSKTVGALALEFLQQTLDRGETIEIPSLGILISGNKQKRKLMIYQVIYEEYLKLWAAKYGERTEATASYYRNGRLNHKTIKRMGLKEFEQASTALRAADEKFQQAETAKDAAAMDAALDEAFSLEIVLLT